MIDRKYLGNYSDIILYCLDNCSNNTTLLLSSIISSEETLLEIEKIINTKPSEEELLEKLEPFKREWLKKFEAKSRLGFINNIVLHFMNPFQMRKIYKTKTEALYVMTFTKSDISLPKKASFLRDFLSTYLRESEELVTADNYISVVGNGYRYSYQLEAYKRANHTVCFDATDIYTELIYRMGVETAISHLRRCCYNHSKKMKNNNYWELFDEKKELVYNRMSEIISQRECNDPVSIFVEIIKQEAKSLM